MRDSLSRTLNTTDIIQVMMMMIMMMMMMMMMMMVQVITRLDVASESSGVGSCAASEGSNSPPLVQQTPGQCQKSISHLTYFPSSHNILNSSPLGVRVWRGRGGDGQ